MKLLLVEDNFNILNGLKYSLEQNNFSVDIASSFNEAKKLLKNKYDLVILDIALPGGNGFKLAKLIDTKKIFLTAFDDEENIVNGLELADDYMTKPFSTRELIARINKILSKSNSIIKVNNVELNLDKMMVYKDDIKVNLTSLEIKILHLLFTNLNRVITRENIIEKIWDWTGNDVNDNTVSVYLKRIREKLNINFIKTVKGIGYMIDYEK